VDGVQDSIGTVEIIVNVPDLRVELKTSDPHDGW
jgi:hypothetical protein